VSSGAFLLKLLNASVFVFAVSHACIEGKNCDHEEYNLNILTYLHVL
jgi:hypothetical protein